MTDEFDYQQPEINDENEGDDDGEGASSAAAAAERMAAESEGSGTSDAKKPASSPSEGGSLERAATASTPATGSGSDQAGEAGGQLRRSEKEALKELQNLIEGKEKKSDVVQKLGTGDTLVKDGKTQHLFMPNGDHLTVKPDGSYELDTKQAVKVKSEKGVTTITYANGDSVEFDQQGIRGIQRGKEAVSFARPNEMQHQLRELKPLKPQSGSSENGPNVIRELQNGGANSTPNRIPEAGSSQREARPAETPNRLPNELSQEELKKLLQRKR